MGRRYARHQKIHHRCPTKIGVLLQNPDFGVLKKYHRSGRAGIDLPEKGTEQNIRAAIQKALMLTPAARVVMKSHRSVTISLSADLSNCNVIDQSIASKFVPRNSELSIRKQT